MVNLNDIERRMRRIEEKLGIENEYPYTLEKILDLDDRTLMEIFREVRSHNMARSLVGLNIEQVKKIKSIHSKNRWIELSQEVLLLRNEEITQSSIKGNREIIFEKIQQLEDMGEIVVARETDRPYVSLDSIPDEPKEPPFDVQSWLHSTFEKA